VNWKFTALSRPSHPSKSAHHKYTRNISFEVQSLPSRISNTTPTPPATTRITINNNNLVLCSTIGSASRSTARELVLALVGLDADSTLHPPSSTLAEWRRITYSTIHLNPLLTTKMQVPPLLPAHSTLSSNPATSYPHTR
jgi:hypothetical protein